MKAGPALSKYFNTAGSPEGYEKRPTGEFAAELKALTHDEKQELGREACEAMDIEFTPAA